MTLCTAAMGAIMAARGMSSWLEAASFVTGAVCVWLTVKESVWNFPISLINVTTFSIVFFQARLFADASLQVVYFVLTLIGWYLWLYGGAHRSALRVARAGAREKMAVLVSVAILTILLWQTVHFFGGSASFWDALTTAISLGAQWLLNRKRLENWMLWIAADIVYVPLYLFKGLYLTSMLYAVFLVMATMGLLQWRATRLRQRNETASDPVMAEAAA